MSTKDLHLSLEAINLIASSSEVGLGGRLQCRQNPNLQEYKLVSLLTPFFTFLL